MLTPIEIIKVAERKYPEYLRSLVKNTAFFPLSVRFGRPKATSDFATLKHQISPLIEREGTFSIVWEERKTRRWGTQRLPKEVQFDSERQYLSALGRLEAATAFKKCVELTKQRLPQLLPWITSNIKLTSESAGFWPGVIEVAEYFLRNPRPNLYRRQLPLSVHTKFIFENEALITSVLTEILPASAKSLGGSFEEKFGLIAVQPLIRMRTNDLQIQKLFGVDHDDFGLPLSRLAAAKPSCTCVLITENEMNFAVIPLKDRLLAIFGSGNAVQLLSKVTWLHEIRLLYWGDIDEHGFQILSDLRRSFPHVESFLMTQEVLDTFTSLIADGEICPRRPQHLSEPEMDAYQRIAKSHSRLEQEKLPLDFVVLKLEEIRL